MSQRLYLDFETFSQADIKKVGSSRYSRDPSTEVLMLAYAVDDGPVRQWLPVGGERMPLDLLDMLLDPAVIKSAWNKTFEWNIFSNVLGINIPHEQWRDTMVLAYSLSLPGSLDKTGEVIGLSSDKKKMGRGKTLIRLFCGPRKPTKAKPYVRATYLTDPTEWAEFKEYNRRDVIAERAIYNRLKKWDMPKTEWELWFLDQEINQAGVPINLDVIKNALKIVDHITADRLSRMAKITGLANPNSPKQLLPWLQSKGYVYDDMKAGHVRTAVEKNQDLGAGSDLITVLKMRQEVSKTSVKKYKTYLNLTDDDGHYRNSLQFAGAGRTMRFAGRGVNCQNLPRPVKYLEDHQEDAVRHVEKLDPESIEMLYDKPMDLLSSCLRPAIQAPKGFLFADADLSAIENRAAGWISRDPKILAVFEKGRDPYVDFATYTTGRTYEDLWHEYKVLKQKHVRNLNKPPTLGCAFGLSAGYEKENPKTGEMEATGLMGYAANMGVRMTQEQAKLAVDVFRETFVNVVEDWGLLEAAAKRTIRTGIGQAAGRVSFSLFAPFLLCRLPSGRHIHYVRPRIENKMMPWGKMRETITYEGLNDQGQWVRILTRGAKLYENIIQAVARDLLVNGLRLAKARGLDTRLHVHDQIVALCRENEAQRGLEILLECMRTPPKWGLDFPLGAEGHISRVFLKD